MVFRIGHGFDVHRLAGVDEAGKKLTLRLAGVDVPHTKGCVAHSDGDVVVHALCDALLGAAAMGDIGLHFPDTSAEFAGIDSMVLLRRVVELLTDKGWKVGNVDCTIMLQTPKVRPFIEKMREALAGTLWPSGSDSVAGSGSGLGLVSGFDAVSVKATTTERLGFVGREEGVAAEAVVLIYR